MSAVMNSSSGTTRTTLPFAKYRALPFTASDSNIRILCLAGTVHDTAHDSHRYGLAQLLKMLLHPVGKRDEVNLDSAASRAKRRWLHPALAGSTS